jgi:polysaccharide pyruvyl transferase WcaK-like protein
MSASHPASTGLRRAVVLDTSVASTNVGDQIIMEAVRSGLRDPLAGALLTTVASHDRMGPKGRTLIRAADVVVAGGSNLISSHMWIRAVWKLGLRDAFLGMNTILMGVGWYQFQRKPDPYTAWLLRRVLHPTALHSVRDSHAQAMLASIGITNVINTGCPTTWGLAGPGAPTFPSHRAEEVVTTLNCYIPDRDADRRLIEMLRARYRRIYAWVQTAEDHAMLRELGEDIVILDPSLAAYDELLASDRSLDYVGNRLHGGIRALQHGRRAIIQEIDNRAKEMGRDLNLPTVERTDFAKLERMIDGDLTIDVRPPLENIARWKAALRQELERA